MTQINDKTQLFLDRYEAALLARDERTIAQMYAVPSLIVFPGNSTVVADQAQVNEFFASAWEQYEGATEEEHRARLMAEAPGTLWVDVTWISPERPRERFCYQLVENDGEYRIGVLTPMAI